MNYPLDILMLPIQLIVAWFTVYYTVIAVLEYGIGKIGICLRRKTNSHL